MVPIALARWTMMAMVSLIIALAAVCGTTSATKSRAFEVYVQARKLVDERVEFALLVGDQRLLPQQRYLASGSTIGLWRFSSHVQIESNPLSDELGEGMAVRIAARRVSGDRVEFGLQVELAGRWSETLLPARRFFPADAHTKRWLRSSPVDLLDAQPQKGFGGDYPECVRILNAFLPSRAGDSFRPSNLNVHVNPSLIGMKQSTERYLSELEFFRADPELFRLFKQIDSFAAVGVTFNSPFVAGDGTVCPGQFVATSLYRDPTVDPGDLGWLASIDKLITTVGSLFNEEVAFTVAR